MTIHSDIAVRRSVSELVAARDTAAMRYREIFQAMESVTADLGEVMRYAPPLRFREYYGVEALIAELDRRCWRHLFEYTGLSQVMDQQAVNDFDKSLDKKVPPEFTLKTIEATFVQFRADSKMIFNRGLVSIFESLNRKYQNNDAFKISRKIIKGHMVQRSFRSGLQIAYYSQQTIRDLDRVMMTLDGKPFDERRLESGMNAAFANYEPYEDEYYHAKAYKNGNIHITFLRDDLLDKANDIIAEWYGGNAVGHRA